MKYRYLVKICTPLQIEECLNQQGRIGYKMIHVQALNTIVGQTALGLPKNEISYQLIFEKTFEMISDETTS